MEGNSNFKIAISFHSSIFGKMGEKWNGMEGNSNAALSDLYSSGVYSRNIPLEKTIATIFLWISAQKKKLWGTVWLLQEVSVQELIIFETHQYIFLFIEADNCKNDSNRKIESCSFCATYLKLS